ncbi:MAG: hypothetical protein WCK00_13545, partial [Deltaproteobacteria bacterium]
MKHGKLIFGKPGRSDFREKHFSWLMTGETFHVIFDRLLTQTIIVCVCKLVVGFKFDDRLIIMI